MNRGQSAHVLECITADGCHTVGDGDRSQAATIVESTTADGGHAVGDGDGSQAATPQKSIVTDGCHAIFISLMRNCFRNDDIARIITWFGCHFSRFDL